jgi:hypothetical protein
MKAKKLGRPPKADVVRKAAGESDYERVKRPFEKSNIEDVTLDKKLDEFIQNCEEGRAEYPQVIDAKVYRLCPNPRFVMAVRCVDGKPDLSEPLLQVEVPRKLRDKLLGKIIKAANVNVGSNNYYHYVK